jgi:hypothetical protein
MTLEAYMVDVEAISLRDVAGDGSQVEVQLKCRRGWVLAIRCIANRGRTIRVSDFRARDRHGRHPRRRLVEVPFADVRRAFGPLAVKTEARAAPGKATR